MKKRREINPDLKTWLIVAIMIIPIVFMIVFTAYRAKPENCINYGNEDYRFVLVYVGSGRSEEIHVGTIKTEDYEKWLDGETGTIFLYSVHLQGRGWMLNLAHITSIENYGSKPSSLPLNFGK